MGIDPSADTLATSLKAGPLKLSHPISLIYPYTAAAYYPHSIQLVCQVSHGTANSGVGQQVWMFNEYNFRHHSLMKEASTTFSLPFNSFLSKSLCIIIRLSSSWGHRGPGARAPSTLEGSGGWGGWGVGDSWQKFPTNLMPRAKWKPPLIFLSP